MKPLFIQSIKAALSGAAVFAVVLAFLCVLSILQEQAYQRGPKVADNDMVGFAWLILMAIGSVGAIFTMGMAGAWFASREDPTPVYALKSPHWRPRSYHYPSSPLCCSGQSSVHYFNGPGPGNT